MKSKRRDFFKIAGLAGIGIAASGFIPPVPSDKASPGVFDLNPEEASKLMPLNRFPRMVHEYFVNRVREIEQKADKRRASLKTKSEAEEYVKEVREKIEKCFGPWPEKTSLNAHVTGKYDRDNYTIENVIFESRPGFPVTANLYIPKGRKFPLPGVVVPCGHYDAGKFDIQHFSALAKLGYVTLIFDPVGQGERIQYLTDNLKPRRVNVNEHIYEGNQMFLTGDSLSAWFAWDGIRAIDYLLSRSEVDPKHIGVTGVSGGGTQTSWMCGNDPRITMAAPACFVTTIRRNLENEEPGDTEQNPLRLLSQGLDHSDFYAAMAPKPVIFLGQEKDFFDIRGTEESFTRLRNLYQLLGAEQNIKLNVGPGFHDYPKSSREAMYSMFNKATKVSDTIVEPAVILEKEETLWCTPHGQVGESGPRTIFSYTKERSIELKLKRGNVNGEALKKAVIETLKLPSYDGVPDFRILRQVPDRNYPKKFSCTYVVETEPGISALVYRLADEDIYYRPPTGLKRAILYISHQSADDELRNEPLLVQLIHDEPDSAIFACDLRGIGESQPNTTHEPFSSPYGSDYLYSVFSIMLDYPYLGQKTYDLLRVINWIKSYGHQEIHLVAKGWGTIPSTFAAMFSDNVTQVTLKNALTSYSEIAENEEYNWPLQCLLPGVLRSFDLPDCYRSLRTKKLRQIEPWNAKGTGV
jgi:dienelactone hydrolase